MGWVKIDDAFPDHSKALKARGLPIALWLEGLCYANKHLTDGMLETHVVSSMRLVPKPLAVAEFLVKVKLWERVEGGFQIHDYAEHYPTAASVRERRALDSARKRGQLPPGFRPDSNVPSRRNPEPRALAGAGSQSDLQSESDRVPPETQWPHADFWETWCEIAGRHHAHQPNLAGPREYEHIGVLVESYTREQLQVALRVWWESPYTNGRNIGLFRSQIGEVLEHLARKDGTVFRAPKPRVEPVKQGVDVAAWAASHAKGMPR